LLTRKQMLRSFGRGRSRYTGCLLLVFLHVRLGFVWLLLPLHFVGLFHRRIYWQRTLNRKLVFALPRLCHMLQCTLGISLGCRERCFRRNQIYYRKLAHQPISTNSRIWRASHLSRKTAYPHNKLRRLFPNHEARGVLCLSFMRLVWWLFCRRNQISWTFPFWLGRFLYKI